MYDERMISDQDQLLYLFYLHSSKVLELPAIADSITIKLSNFLILFMNNYKTNLSLFLFQFGSYLLCASKFYVKKYSIDIWI